MKKGQPDIIPNTCVYSTVPMYVCMYPYTHSIVDCPTYCTERNLAAEEFVAPFLVPQQNKLGE